MRRLLLALWGANEAAAHLLLFCLNLKLTSAAASRASELGLLFLRTESSPDDNAASIVCVNDSAKVPAAAPGSYYATLPCRLPNHFGLCI